MLIDWYIKIGPSSRQTCPAALSKLGGLWQKDLAKIKCQGACRVYVSNVSMISTFLDVCLWNQYRVEVHMKDLK